MFLAFLAFLLGGAALFVALCRDPLQPGFVFRSPMSDSLEGYDISSPTAMEKTAVQATLNGDVRALAELESRRAKKYKETIDTLTATEIDVTEQPKKKGEGHSGQFKILLAKFKSGGEETKQILAYEKNSESGLWEKVPDPSKLIERIKDAEQTNKIAEFMKPDPKK